jgi:hypothetical protein
VSRPGPGYGLYVPGSRGALTLLLLAAALGSGGCARDGDRAAVRTVAGTFFAALGSGDSARACDQLSPGTRAKLESQEQKDCRQAVTGLGLQGGMVADANVYVLNAIVELGNGDAVFLEQGREGWRIAAAGCSIKAGKPADHPYDCELED